MNLATPLDAAPASVLTDSDYLRQIYMLLVIIAVIMIANFVHRILRVSFRMIRGDINDEK